MTCTFVSHSDFTSETDLSLAAGDELNGTPLSSFPSARRPQSHNSTNQVYEKSAYFREKGPAFFWPFIHSSIQQPCLTWPAIPGAPGEIDHSMVMAPFPPPLLLRSPCRWPMALLSSQTHSTRHSFCRIFCLLLRCQTDAPPFRYLIGFNKGPQ